MRKIYDQIKHELTLFLLIIFHALNIFQWFNLRIWPKGKAYQDHIINFSALIEKIDRGANLSVIFFSNQENPPFFYLAAYLTQRIFKFYRTIFLTPAFFLIALIIIVYLIGKVIGNKEIGVFAAVICSFFPLIYYSAITFNLEMATITMFSLAILVLITKNFIFNSVDAFCLGVTLGLMALTRSFCVFFIIGPFFVMFKKLQEEANNNQKDSKMKILKNLFIVFFTFFCLGMIFYHQPEFYYNFLSKIIKTDHSWPDSFFYLKVLKNQIGWLGFAAFSLGLLVLNKTKWEKFLFFVWICLPFLLLVISPKKHECYLSSLLPPVAIIMAMGISDIKNIFTKNLLLIVLVIMSMSFYFKSF